jgi:sugar phosphate isomerase/epimerase
LQQHADAPLAGLYSGSVWTVARATLTVTEFSRGLRLAANYYLAPPDMGVAEFMAHAKYAGAEGVGLTVASLNAHSPEQLAALARDNGLFISSLNSAGYFLFADAGAQAKQAELNKRLLDAAARMQSDWLVVITGGILDSGMSLEGARARVAEEIGRLDETAATAGIRLAVEPVHPVDLTAKGCINSIGQALKIVRGLPSTAIVVDIFHSAWDPDLWQLPALAGDKLAFVQVCNWYEPTADEKPQRDLPSAGVMDLAGWLSAMLRSGYRGTIEFEMFDRHRRGRAVPEILCHALEELRRYLAIDASVARGASR